MPLLDDHSTCITRKYGKTMEIVHQTDDKKMSSIIISSMEAFSSNPTIIRTLGRTQHSKQHVHLLSATQLFKKEPSFD